MKNPFHASFGVSPPLLVGRDDLLDDFAEALEDGPGSAGRATLYTGARGAGKTVLLNAVEDRARERGWLIVSETATPGFVSRITSVSEHPRPRLRLHRASAPAVQRRMSGVASARLPIAGERMRRTASEQVWSPAEMLTDLRRRAPSGRSRLLTIHQNDQGCASSRPSCSTRPVEHGSWRSSVLAWPPRRATS